MYFSIKNYLKSNHNYTAKHTIVFLQRFLNHFCNVPCVVFIGLGMENAGEISGWNTRRIHDLPPGNHLQF